MVFGKMEGGPLLNLNPYRTSLRPVDGTKSKIEMTIKRRLGYAVATPVSSPGVLKSSGFIARMIRKATTMMPALALKATV